MTSLYLSLKGRSDTLFAKIIDKMVLPVGLIKTQAASANNLKASNVSMANNQNSILMSLKDTLHSVKLLFIR